ncbi:MAG: hypothetical protein V3R37_01310 [Rhodospirillales bacterium]
MSANGHQQREIVKETIYKACLNLDEQKWGDWIDQCDKDFKYSVTTYSHEIRRDLTYLILKYKELKPYFDLLPKHNTDHSPIRRHATVYSVDMADDGKSADAVTSFLITQEMFDGINAPLDSGENRLFLVGKYHDKFKVDGDKVTFAEREARIFTRRLDKGTHWVF